MEIILANQGVILLFLLSLSEVLALIPSIKANSIFQLIVILIKKIAGK
jgi:energy-converting hydrogenase Eha subunit E